MNFASILLVLSVAGTSALYKVTPAKDRMADMQGLVRKLQGFSEAFVSKGRRLEGHDGGMGAMANPACQEACPGVKDFMFGMLSGIMGTSTPPPPGSEGTAMMELMCPHVEAIKCMGTADACKEEGGDAGDARRLDAHGEGGDMDMMAMLGCGCACPKIAAMGGDGRRLESSTFRRLEGHGGEGEGDDESMKAMCEDPEGTIGCIATKDECSSMMDMFMAGATGMSKDDFLGTMGVACEYQTKECQKKGDSMDEGGSCEGGAEAMKSWGEKKCGEGGEPSACCAEAGVMKTCQTEDCLKLAFAMASMSQEPEGKKSFENMIAISKACPEVGMPQSEAEVTAIKQSKAAMMTGAPDPNAAPAGDADDGFKAIPSCSIVSAALAIVVLGSF